MVEHRADDRVTFEVFLPIMQVGLDWLFLKIKFINFSHPRLFAPEGQLTQVMTLLRDSGILTRLVLRGLMDYRASDARILSLASMKV